MAESKYGKYINGDPYVLAPGEMAHHDSIIKERNAEGLIFLNSKICPETSMFAVLNRSYGVPDPQPYLQPHRHDVDEIVFFLAMTPDHTLGATAEWYMGDEGVDQEKFFITRSTCVFVPAGVTHGPMFYRDFQPGRMFYMISVLAKPDYDEGD